MRITPVPSEAWERLTSEAAGIKYACWHAEQPDKAVALDVCADKATLSRAKTGEARLPFESLHTLMDSTGCEAPLYAHLLRRGYDPRSLRKLETETERALREAKERVEALENEKRVLIEALRSNA